MSKPNETCLLVCQQPCVYFFWISCSNLFLVKEKMERKFTEVDIEQNGKKGQRWNGFMQKIRAAHSTYTYQTDFWQTLHTYTILSQRHAKPHCQTKSETICLFVFLTPGMCFLQTLEMGNLYNYTPLFFFFLNHLPSS